MVTANELKTKGIQAINQEIKAQEEAIISYKGKPTYVVLTIDEYNKMKENELDLAYLKAQEDIKNGNYTEVSTMEELEEYLSRL